MLPATPHGPGAASGVLGLGFEAWHLAVLRWMRADLPREHEAAPNQNGQGAQKDQISEAFEPRGVAGVRNAANDSRALTRKSTASHATMLSMIER